MREKTFDLERFVEAQAGVYTRALEELRAGEKRSRWMWFIFPQIGGLGSSAMAQRYAIGSLAEARDYLAHPVLGARLLECTAAVNGLAKRSASEIFGWPDELKFCSSMTLFAAAARFAAAPSNPGTFQEALRKYFDGEGDAATVQRLPSYVTPA